MSANLHLLQASDRLDPFIDEIKEAFDQAIQKINKHLNVLDIDVVVADHPRGAIDEEGVGGRMLTKHYVRISIDPEHDNVQENLGIEIRRSLAHELNHCVWHDIHGSNETLMETLIMEGLAQHFDRQLHPDADPYPWSVAVKGERLQGLRERARKKFDNEDYDYRKWFFGIGDNDIPKWTGYAIGFTIVGEYMKKVGKPASELMDIPPEEFVKTN
jgi:uncharacterized protein YjaZ